MLNNIRNKINKVDKKTKIVFGLFALLFLLVMKGSVGNVGSPEELEKYFETPNVSERLGKTLATDRVLSQYIGMVSIVDYGQIDIPDELIGHSGRDIGFNKDERVFSWFPIGLQVISAPFYWIGKIINMSLVFSHLPIILISFVNLILLYLISVNIFKLPKKIGHLVAFIYGFSSVALPYSVMFIPHQVSTLLLLSCFYLAFLFTKQESVRKKILIMSSIWAMWGLSSFFDYPNWVIISPVFVYLFFKVFKKKKDLIILFSTGLIGLAALFGQGLYNHIVYDNWQQMSNTLPQYTWRIEGSVIETIDEFDEIIEKKNNPLNILNLSSIKKGLNVLLVSPDRGLFVFTPVFILSLFGYWRFFRKKNHEKMFLLYAPLLTILVYAMFGDPWGGWAFGARYLLPVMAIMSISLGILYSKIKNVYFRGLVVVLAIFSTVQSVAGVMSTTAIHQGDRTMVYGIKNYYFLIENVSGNFWYINFLQSSIPVISLFAIVLFIFIGVFVYILKD